MNNTFLNQLGKSNTTTWNGAVSNSTTGSSVLDYFAKCGSYRGRTYQEVNSDMASIFGDDPTKALKVVFYNRMITRKAKGFEHACDSVQRGQGQKDEFIKSLAWIENNYPEYLYKNLWLIPVVGSWKDLFYDSASTNFHYYISPHEVYKLIKAGLQSDYHCALIAKYLPKIRSNRNVKNDRHRRLNIWARNLCKYLGWTEKDYRKFKSNPQNCAHLYQRKMCANEWDDIDFNMIPGKALFNMLSQTGRDKQNSIERHKLENKYLDWIKNQPVAKFTGYPYELYKKAKNEYRKERSLIQKYTYDAQFNTLLEKAKDSVPKELLEKGVLCALDTSGSMCSSYYYSQLNSNAMPTPIDVCVGLGIYFASLIEGYFHNHVIMFDNKSKFFKFQGESFCDKCDQIDRHATAWGSTNFQSVIDEIVRVRKQNPEIPVSDFPQVLLCVSDMQFNPEGNNTETNYEVAMKKLQDVGLPDMTIIWWNVAGRFSSDFPSTLDDPGTVLISGFDGSIITTILGGTEKIVDEKTGEERQRTPEEMMELALNQEILQKLSF